MCVYSHENITTFKTMNIAIILQNFLLSFCKLSPFPASCPHSQANTDPYIFLAPNRKVPGSMVFALKQNLESCTEFKFPPLIFFFFFSIIHEHTSVLWSEVWVWERKGKKRDFPHYDKLCNSPFLIPNKYSTTVGFLRLK